MPKLSAAPCPRCQKPLEVKGELRFSSEILQQFKCGHSFAKDSINLSTLNFGSLDGSGHVARPYQQEGVEKGLEAIELHGGFLLADQMRLGKTPQALLIAKNLGQFPVLILPRAANVYQWVREAKKWCNSLPAGVWVIDGTKSFIPPGFSIYICSMDTFGRRGACKSCKHQFHDDDCTKCLKEAQTGKREFSEVCHQCQPAGDAMSDKLLEFGFKLCIVDEAHSMKNTDSQRCRALVSFLKEIERSSLVETIPFTCSNCKHTWEEQIEIKVDTTEETHRVKHSSHCEKCFTQVSYSSTRSVKVEKNCKVLLLTGTAIKNRADEYFVPLNLISPGDFPSLNGFRNSWLDPLSGYKRVKTYRIDEFKERIAPFVLRREKEDIYKELPSLNRIFSQITIEDERLKKAYNKVVDQIEENIGRTGNFSYFSNIGELQQLRQICGLAKANFVADYAESFVCDSEKAKLAIGYHHMSVRDQLWAKLEPFGVCKLDGQDSPQRKDYIAHKYFQTASEQILLLGEQACKEGLELVYIDYALVTERQWSSSEEEQFEYRFYNPDLNYLKSRGLENKKTTIEYIIAKGTTDQFLGDLVEEKREIFGETIANNWSLDQDAGSFRELLERTVSSRL
jgi:hypothetical protein